MFDFTEILGGIGLSAVVIGIYWYFTRPSKEEKPQREPPLPPLPKQDFTLEHLKQFDGVQNGRRILMAICGNVFDVSNRADFYGPGGPYGIFAGRDASRGLATMSLDAKDLRDGYDDLADLSSMERSMLTDWETQFKQRYAIVGRLLKPGEEPTLYDTEGLGTSESSTTQQFKKQD